MALEYKESIKRMETDQADALKDAWETEDRFNVLMHKPIIPAEKSDDADDVARISYDEVGCINVSYKYSHAFTDVAHSAHLRWGAGKWEYPVSKQSKWEDCEAEIATLILAAGYPVKVDPEVRDKVIFGKYEPDYVRWITARSGEFCRVSIRVGDRYDSRFDGMYQAAMKLPGARYTAQRVTVDVKHYEEIEAFAEENGYRITQKAAEILDTFRSESRVRVTPKQVQLDAKVSSLSGDDLLAALRDD